MTNKDVSKQIAYDMANTLKPISNEFIKFLEYLKYNNLKIDDGGNIVKEKTFSYSLYKKRRG